MPRWTTVRMDTELSFSFLLSTILTTSTFICISQIRKFKWIVVWNWVKFLKRKTQLNGNWACNTLATSGTNLIFGDKTFLRSKVLRRKCASSRKLASLLSISCIKWVNGLSVGETISSFLPQIYYVNQITITWRISLWWRSKRRQVLVNSLEMIIPKLPKKDPNWPPNLAKISFCSVSRFVWLKLQIEKKADVQREIICLWLFSFECCTRTFEWLK